MRSRIEILDEELYNDFRDYYKRFNGSIFRDALNDFIDSLNLETDSRRYVSLLWKNVTSLRIRRNERETPEPDCGFLIYISFI